MTNLFLQLVFLYITSVLNRVNLENVEENKISAPGHSAIGNKLQNSNGRLNEIENADSDQDSDDTPKELPIAGSANVAPMRRQSDSKVNYQFETNPIAKRESLKKSLDGKVKSSNQLVDEYPETVEGNVQVINEELEKEYMKQISEDENDWGEEDDDEDKDEEPNNEDDENDQNTSDDDNKEELNSGVRLSHEDRVSCGSKPNGGSTGKRRKENVNWLLLQPSNDSLTFVRHKSLVRSEDRYKRRNKKGVRHELDDEKYKMKDLKDMNTMKKKLSEEDMYKRILLNLDSDSEKEKEMKKWEKFKSGINGGDMKRRKQKKKGKYKYLKAKDLNHGGNRRLTNDEDSVFGRKFADAKLKAPFGGDHLNVGQGKENKKHSKYNGRRKHKKPLRKFKDNFEDIINNKISKCQDSSSDDSKKQKSFWEVENKGDDKITSKKKTHENSINKHGKVKHFLENNSKFQSDNLVQDNLNNDGDSPIQVYRIDVENRKIIPVIDGDSSSGRRRETHNSGDSSDYIGMPYNISIEFLQDPAAKDMRKRSLKYFNEEYSQLPSKIYDKDKKSVNNVMNERIFKNDLSAFDKNSLLRQEIISDVYNAIKVKNPQLFGTEHITNPGLFDTEQIRNSKLFNTGYETVNKLLRNSNVPESGHSSAPNMNGKNIYNRYSNQNNIYPEIDKSNMRASANIVNNNFIQGHQYGENEMEAREFDVKRNANNNNLLSELSKLVQKKSAKNVTSTTEAYTTETDKNSQSETGSTMDTTCMELFTRYTGGNNNNEVDENEEKVATDSQWVTIPSVCMTSKAGGDKSHAGKSKTTQPAKHGGTAVTPTSQQRPKTTTPVFDGDKFPDMLSGKLADRFFAEVSKKINRSRKISRELGLCNEKFKPDPMRRCIEIGPEELLPLSSMKNILYKLEDNKRDTSFLCNAIPSELNSFLTFIIGNTKQTAKECLAVKKDSNFLFKTSAISKEDSNLKNQNDFNLIPEKQLKLEKSKLNRKTGKSDDYDEEEKENVDDVLTQTVLGNKSKGDKSGSNRQDVSEFLDNILRDDVNRLRRGDTDRTKSIDSTENNDYDYNVNPYSYTADNYGNRELERFYYGNGDTNSEMKSGYTIFRDKASDGNDDRYSADINVDRGSKNKKNNSNSFKNLLASGSIFNTISNKIFKNKEDDLVKAKRQRLSDSMKIKMHNLLYEDSVPVNNEYYDDDDVRVKKDTENSNTYDDAEDYDYNGYNMPFSDDNKIADDSNLEDAFVVRTPVEEYNSYYE